MFLYSLAYCVCFRAHGLGCAGLAAVIRGVFVVKDRWDLPHKESITVIGGFWRRDDFHDSAA